MPQIQVFGPWPCEYSMRGDKTSQELILLLHGFQQTGGFMFNRFESFLPAGSAVLAPNGPFPVFSRPFGYAWYVYDPSSDEYRVGMGHAEEYLANLVKTLGLDHLPKRVVGYSQGGYLAPFVGIKLSRVKQVIGMASQFLDQELPTPLSALPFRMDSIHGDSDEVVSIENSRKSQENLARAGVSGKFRTLEGIGHKITPEFQKALGETILL